MKKSFSQLGSLSRHKLIHSELKCHQCEICKKSFITKWEFFWPMNLPMNFWENRWILTDEFFEFQPVIGILPGDLRVFLSIFDQTLTAHFLKTDDARTNRFLLLEQLTPKVHDDSISDDNAPSSGSNELIKFKLQTLSTFATVIRFWWQYHHSTGN